MNETTLACFLTWTTYGTWLPGDERGWVELHGGFERPTPEQSEIASRRVRVPRSRRLRRGRAKEAETWIVDGAMTATSTALPQTV